MAPFPRAYCRPWLADQREIRHRAALTSAGPPAALSHITALCRCDLLVPSDDDVHVTVPVARAPSQTSELIVHRTRRFPPVCRIDGLPTVMPPVAIVSSWPLLAADSRRAPAITAVRRRLVSPEDLSGELARQPRLQGRAELASLVELLVAGCESELEIWGLLHVFDVPGLRHGVRQHWVATAGKRYRLDLAYVAERVAVELDGWATHGTKAAREVDATRDAALAAAGWLTLRFSYRRLHDDVAGCRRETLAVLAHRRP